MRKQGIGMWVVAGICLSLWMGAESVEGAPYYEGKLVKIVVASTPGGGYDRMARLLAKFLPNHIPGKPTFIVENMPGAGSIVAGNYIYSIAKPNGLTIGALQRGIQFAQMTKVDGVRFDMSKYAWIGSPSVESTVFCVRSDLPYKVFDDLRRAKEPIPVASAGPGATAYQYPFLLKEFLGISFKMVIYPSGTECLLALERKEVDGQAGSFSSFKPYLARGVLRMLVRGRVSEPGIENLPVDEEMATDPKGKAIMSLRSGGDVIGRPYVAPPGTPRDVMNILRDAFAKATKDPELRDAATKLQMTLQYVPGDECVKIIKEALNQPETVVKEFSKYITF